MARRKLYDFADHPEHVEPYRAMLTTPPPTTGEDNTSLVAWAFHSCLPLASNARAQSKLPPSTTMPPTTVPWPDRNLVAEW